MRTLRRIGTLVGLLGLTAASVARADFTRPFLNTCGGTTFRTCASVELSVDPDANLLLRVRNLAGLLGSYPNAVFTFIALRNLPLRADPYEYTLLDMSGPMFQPSPGTPPDPWANTVDTFNDRVQFEPLFGFGFPDGGIVSSCIDLGAAPVPLGGYWATPAEGCGTAGIIDPGANGGWVELRFADDFASSARWSQAAVDRVQLELYALDGADPLNPRMASLLRPSDVGVVPEPVSILLMGTGLAGVAVVRRIRRKRRGER